MKRILSVVLALALVLGLVSVASAADFTINVNIWDSNQQAGLQEIADDWTKISGVPVKIEVVNWDSYWTLLAAGAQGGEMPDVFWTHSNTVQMYMDNDLLLKLNDYIAKDGVDMNLYYEDIVKLYTRAVEYPTDDWTWEDMYAAAQKIQEGGAADGVYGMAMNTSNNQDGWYNLVYDYGGKVITDDHKGTTIGSDEGKAGMEMVRKLLTAGAPQGVVAETGTDSLFQSDKVGMITQGSWMINSFYKAEHHDDYAWACLPYADVNGNGQCDDGERWSCYNGLGWAAAYNTQHPDECASLIEYFCSVDAQKKQAELGVTMAGIKGISDEFANAFPGMDVSAFTKAESFKLYFRPYTRNTVAWEDPIQQAGGFLDAWQNPADPALMATACENAQRIIEEAIAAE